ncbi:hypothetical protein AD945_17520 [Gluconobacter albidus]|uniref:Uncharacterized protein n=1 Tax=Gluconobacter albidus TaxID=318683 RepID=A0A149TEN4_9PROT|nr:hypothetical protein [Gluconobacter albidus]KXV45945.1 hypothetical protein AD945_17520 [Gluconobacter albidus]
MSDEEKKRLLKLEKIANEALEQAEKARFEQILMRHVLAVLLAKDAIRSEFPALTLEHSLSTVEQVVRRSRVQFEGQDEGMQVHLEEAFDNLRTLAEGLYRDLTADLPRDDGGDPE